MSSIAGKATPGRALLAVAALTSATAFAGLYDQPYALVESGDASEVRKESRLAITKVDGESTRDARGSDPIAPGKHRITLHFESARGHFRPEFLHVELDLEACTRYRIVAKYEVVTGPSWSPVAYPEPIGECRRKFMRKGEPAK